jgi:hypothetical protein
MFRAEWDGPKDPSVADLGGHEMTKPERKFIKGTSNPVAIFSFS